MTQWPKNELSNAEEDGLDPMNHVIDQALNYMDLKIDKKGFKSSIGWSRWNDNRSQNRKYLSEFNGDLNQSLNRFNCQSNQAHMGPIETNNP